MKKKTTKSEEELLRERAEELYKKMQRTAGISRRKGESLRLVHELEVHQIELEMQNQELEAAREQAVAEREKYVELYDFSPSGYFLLSEEGKILDVNHAGAALWGHERGVMIGRSFHMRLSPKTREPFRAFLADAFKSRVKQQCDVIVVGQNEQSLYIHLAGIASGSGEKCFVSAVDLTEQKQAQSRLTEMIEYSQKIFESSPVGVTTFKSTGEAVSANRAAANIVGGSIQQLEAQNFRNLPAWRESGLLGAADAALTSGMETDVEVHSVSTFGKEIWLSARFLPFTHMGERRLLYISEDIGRQKKTEEKLISLVVRNEIILRTASDGIHILDGQGSIVEANDAFCSMVGYTRDEIKSLNVRDWDAHLSKDAREEILREMSTIPRVFETVYRRRDGQLRNVEISGVGVQIDGAKKFYAAARDITERKQAEKLLHDAAVGREKLVAELEVALENVRTLEGIIPICANCKKIRDDEGLWNQLEKYLSSHSDARFTHGICPDCVKLLYGDVLPRKDA